MIFLDSSFLISFEVDADSNHDMAVKLFDEITKGKFGLPIISDYIFDETVTMIFARTKDLSKAIESGIGMKQSYQIKKIDEPIFEKAWSLFQKQKSTKFSFTDCTILTVMEENGIKNIATFDEDFKKIKEINVVS